MHHYGKERFLLFNFRLLIFDNPKTFALIVCYIGILFIKFRFLIYNFTITSMAELKCILNKNLERYRKVWI